MLAKINYSLDNDSDDIIDLEDYGYDIATKWDDLTNKQRLEILGELETQRHACANGESLCPNDNSDYYDEEKLQELEGLGLIEEH